MSITYISASGKDIARIVEKIEDVVVGEQNVNVALGCLVVAVLVQKPEIAPAQLQEIVKGASEWLASNLYDGSGTVH
jgi:hypothetical protein